MTVRRVLVAGVLLVAVAGAGCAPDGMPGGAALRVPAPALPDLSATDPFVREQVRAEHAALVETVRAGEADDGQLAEAFGGLGTLLMAAGLLEAAEPYLARARGLAPDDTRWPYYLGHLYRSIGALEDAGAAFEAVLDRRPDDAVALLSLGDVQLQRGRPELAASAYRQQLTLQPDSVVAHVGLGRAALAQADYAAAVRHLEEALRLSGRTAVGVHYPLALAYRGLGDLERAEEHLRQRVDIAILPEDPLMEALDELIESPRAYEQRGNRALTQGEWAAAAAQFRQGLALDPDDPTLRHRLGTALFQMGDPRAAAAQFEQVVRTHPEFALAHFSLGVLLEGAGLRAEAIERFEAAVEHDPEYVEARLGLASLLRRAGRLDESLAQYEEAMAEGAPGDPRLEEAPFGAAVTLVRLRRYAEARDRLLEARADYPEQPFFVHALARLLSGAPDDTIRDGARALGLMEGLPEDARRLDLGETMAMVLAEVGRVDDALRWQREAIDRATRGGRPDLVPRMREKLARYERGRPWRHDDPVEFDPFLERASALGR